MRALAALLTAAALLALAGCVDQRKYAQAVYVLVDTSGTYVKQLDKAESLINYLLGTLQPGDSLAVARIKSRSFDERDILAKATFTDDPLAANRQKLAFKREVARLAEETSPSDYTDITGGVLQAAQFLNETGAGRKTILIFSDLQQDLDKRTIREVPMNLEGIRVVALNVTKLKADNIDPRRYMSRIEWWEDRVIRAGATEWRIVNDLEHLERIFES